MVSALNRKLLRDLWNLRGQALAIAMVIAESFAEAHGLRPGNRLGAILHGTGGALPLLREVTISSFYETMAETLLIFAFINTLLAGSIAFGVVYNSARIAFSARSWELASLRVLGFTRGEIAYILLGELLLLTLAAIPLGFIIGWTFCHLIVDNLASEIYRIPLVIESATVVLASTAISALIIWRKLCRLDLVAVLKTRE